MMQLTRKRIQTTALGGAISGMERDCLGIVRDRCLGDHRNERRGA